MKYITQHLNIIFAYRQAKQFIKDQPKTPTLQEIKEVSDNFLIQFYHLQNNYKPPLVCPAHKLSFLTANLSFRFTQETVSGIKQETNRDGTINVNQFQMLQIQLHDCKAQLALSTIHSKFTKLSSTQDEFMQTFKQENTKASPLLENPQYSLTYFQTLINFMQKSHPVQQNQQQQFLISTKNILRNICNAQNQYIMFNQSASEIIHQHTNNPPKFKQWVNRLRFHTFDQFQRVWTSKKRVVFTKLYKKLCRKFYLENAIPYIINSRIKNKETKKAHIRYLYRFLEGVESPEEFFYFKQKDRTEDKQHQIR